MQSVNLSPATMRRGRRRLRATFSLLMALGLLGLVGGPARAQQGSAAADLPRPAYDSVSGLERIIAERKAKFQARQEALKQQEEAEKRAEAARKKAGKPAPRQARMYGPQRKRYEKAGTGYLEAYLFYLRQRAYPNDTVDWSAYRRAVQQRERMPAARWGGGQVAGLGASWTFMGPQNLPVPYRIYYGEGTTSGRVNGLAYDHSNPGTYYLAAAGGGLWKTTNFGVNWTPLSDGWEHLQVTDVAVHPTNSSILYVGTGDFNGWGGLGFGLMKSTDGGTTWTNLGKAQFGNFAVSSILIDPEDPNIITVATGRPPDWWGQVWRSTNGGTSWTAVITTVAAWSDLAYSAKTAGGVRYYYAVGHYNGGQFWRSSDRGATWTKLAPPLSNNNWWDHESLEVATSPTNPNIVYLIVGFDQIVLKSTSRGDNGTWSNITGTLPGGYNWSQNSYDVHLTTSTRGAGIDVLYGGLITLAQSPSGDASWQDIGITYSNGALTHNDQHSMAINPSNANESLVGNDGGVYRLTYDPASNAWSFDTSLNRRLGITQFYRIDAHPTNANRMIGGTQDNATPVSNGDLANWLNRGGGDGGFCAINPQNPNIQYATSQFLGIYQTTDGWASGNWWGNNVITPNTGSDRKAFIAPIALDPSNPHLLYAGTNYLWRYNDNTDTWTARLGGQELSATGAVMYIAVAPSDGNRIYTGASDGEVWMTTNGGSTWTKINTGSPGLPNRTITSIAVDPTNPSRVFVGVSGTGTGHIFRCNNTLAGTRVWTNISGSGATGLPDISLNSIALDIDDPTNTYYVATDVGVFYTTDGGANWSNATQPLGLPNVQVNDLKIVAGTRKLYAGTYGRGIWRIDLPGGGGGVTIDSVTFNPSSIVGCKTSTGTVTLSAPASSDTTVNLSSNNGAATVPASITIPSGATSRTFTVATSAVGSNTDVTITATAGSSSKTGTLTLTPPKPTKLVFNPATVTGGCKNSTGKVTMECAVAVNTTVSLTILSGGSAVQSMPATVTVPAGATTTTFTVNTKKVTSLTTVSIQADANGGSKTGTLKVRPPVPKSVTFNPNPVKGGNNSTGTVTLDCAPLTDVVVTLSVVSGGSAISSLPGSVTVAAGSTTATFTVGTRSVAALTTAKIRAKANNVAKTGALKVNP